MDRRKQQLNRLGMNSERDSPIWTSTITLAYVYPFVLLPPARAATARFASDDKLTAILGGLV